MKGKPPAASRGRKGSRGELWRPRCVRTHSHFLQEGVSRGVGCEGVPHNGHDVLCPVLGTNKHRTEAFGDCATKHTAASTERAWTCSATAGLQTPTSAPQACLYHLPTAHRHQQLKLLTSPLSLLSCMSIHTKHSNEILKFFHWSLSPCRAEASRTMEVPHLIGT